MPRIATFMYCDRAEPNPQGQLNITNPLLAINPVFIPGMFSFAMVFGVVDIDKDEDHTVQVQFFTPNDGEGPLIDTNTINLTKGSIQEEKSGLPPHLSGMMFNLDFRNVVFKTEGIYKSHVYFDGEFLGEFPIYAKGGER
jgi:hypothetical protein